MSSSVGVSPGGGSRQPTKITEGSIGAAEASRFRQAGAARQKEREAAIAEVRGRDENSMFPSTLGAIGSMVRKNIVSALERGAQPVQVRSRSGKLITVGALESDGTYTGRMRYRDIAREAPGGGTIMTSAMEGFQREQAEEKARGDDERAPRPEIQPPSPEEIPEGFEYDAATNELIETSTGRRTRFQRRRGGSLMEGGGVLYD